MLGFQIHSIIYNLDDVENDRFSTLDILYSLFFWKRQAILLENRNSITINYLCIFVLQNLFPKSKKN